LGNYRDRFDIIADILKIARRNPKKTQIMYQANLSYKVLKKYLSETVRASLISYAAKGRCYSLTEKGREFLTIYNEYSKANKFVKKRLKDVQIKRGSLEKLCLTEEMTSSF
jgi:predicted transcriptional regulator